jgi:hypothetical protein
MIDNKQLSFHYCDASFFSLVIGRGKKKKQEENRVSSVM